MNAAGTSVQATVPRSRRSSRRTSPPTRSRRCEPPPGEPEPLPAARGDARHDAVERAPGGGASVPSGRSSRASRNGRGWRSTFVDFPELGDWITAEKAEGDPPDLAAAIPGIIVGPRAAGSSRGPGARSWMPERLKADQSPYLVSLGTHRRDGSWPAERGHLFGAFTQLNVKGLVWYPAPELQRAGSCDPGDVGRARWHSAAAAGRRRDPVVHGLGVGRRRAGGRPPTGSRTSCSRTRAPRRTTPGRSTSCPSTVRPSGTRSSVSARSSSPRARSAADPRVLSETFFDDAQHPMLEDPPGCWLYLFPTFASGASCPRIAWRTTDTFPFPPLRGAGRRSDRRWRDDRRVLRPAGGSGGAPIPPQPRAWRGVRRSKDSSSCRRTATSS